MIQQNSSTPRIAVIGCGAIAELYHLPALAQDPHIRNGLVLVDSNQARAVAMAAKFCVHSTANNFEDLIGQIDGAIVATPPALHFSMSSKLLQHGIHVLCEKPLAETYQEASQLVQLAAASKVTLSVNQTRRLFPTYGKIRQFIAEGVLGEIRSIQYHDGFEFSWPAATGHYFRQGARGAWSDTGIHLLDTVCWWLDGQPEIVDSRNDSFGGPEAMATVRLRHRQADIELKVSRLGRLRNRFRIEGTLGRIDAGNEDWQAISVQFHDGGQRRIKLKCAAVNYNDFAQPLMQNFVQVLRGRAQPLIAAESALPGVALLEQAYAMATLFPMPWNTIWESVDVASR